MGEGASPLFPPHTQDEVRSDVQEQLYRSPHFCGLSCSRWSLEHLRQTVSWMRPLSLPGISKLLRRLQISYQRGREHITSPDPLYEQKLEAIAQARMLCMWMPERFVFLYEDEHTYGRQPSASRAYARRGGPTPTARQAPRYWTKRRIAGCLDVQTGTLISRERSRFNVREMANFFLWVEQHYPQAERIYIALDNWPVHFHGYVLDMLREHHSRITCFRCQRMRLGRIPLRKCGASSIKSCSTCILGARIGSGSGRKWHVGSTLPLLALKTCCATLA